MNNKGSSLTPAQALEKLDALYEQSVNALRSAISEYIDTGKLPDQKALCDLGWQRQHDAKNPRLRPFYPLRLLQHHRHPPGPVPPVS